MRPRALPAPDACISDLCHAIPKPDIAGCHLVFRLSDLRSLPKACNATGRANLHVHRGSNTQGESERQGHRSMPQLSSEEDQVQWRGELQAVPGERLGLRGKLPHPLFVPRPLSSALTGNLPRVLRNASARNVTMRPRAARRWTNRLRPLQSPTTTPRLARNRLRSACHIMILATAARDTHRSHHTRQVHLHHQERVRALLPVTLDLHQLEQSNGAHMRRRPCAPSTTLGLAVKPSQITRSTSTTAAVPLCKSPRQLEHQARASTPQILTSTPLCPTHLFPAMLHWE